MKIIFVMAVLFMHVSCDTNNEKNQIKGDYVLLEVAETKASCGIQSVWVGMKFKKQNGDLTFIGLVHCPDGYEREKPEMEFFVAGDVYEIVATKTSELPKGDVKYNEYSDLGLPIYRIDELKLKKSH